MLSDIWRVVAIRYQTSTYNSANADLCLTFCILSLVSYHQQFNICHISTRQSTNTYKLDKKNRKNYTHTNYDKLHKQRIRYKKQKKICDPYDRKQYLELRRKTKKAIHKIEKDYLENHLSKPLKKENSKPFYQHPKSPKSGKTISSYKTWCDHGNWCYWVCEHIE